MGSPENPAFTISIQNVGRKAKARTTYRDAQRLPAWKANPGECKLLGKGQKAPELRGNAEPGKASEQRGSQGLGEEPRDAVLSQGWQRLPEP